MQHNLKSAICAFTGCTLLLCGFLKPKLNPIVKPLLDSARVCSNHFTREILASAFCLVKNLKFWPIFFSDKIKDNTCTGEVTLFLIFEDSLQKMECVVIILCVGCYFHCRDFHFLKRVSQNKKKVSWTVQTFSRKLEFYNEGCSHCDWMISKISP